MSASCPEHGAKNASGCRACRACRYEARIVKLETEMAVLWEVEQAASALLDDYDMDVPQRLIESAIENLRNALMHGRVGREEPAAGRGTGGEA